MSPTTFCLLFAAIYGFIRSWLAVRWLFDSADMWAAAFEPFMDPNYWSLLGAKFIGNRNLAIGLPIFICLILGKPRLVALLLFGGIIIDLPDAIELAIGKSMGYEGPGTDFYMYGAWGLSFLLFLCATHLMLERPADGSGRGAS